MQRILRITILSAVLLGVLHYGLLLYGRINARYERTHPTRGVLQPIKVFQIGFSKCGTVTLANFFSSNGIPTIHHGSDGILPLTMYQNHQQNRPLISPEFNQYYVFTDLDLLQHEPQISIGMQLFKELDKQYPDSKFILNTRDKTAWLKSRSRQTVAPDRKTLLQITAQMHGISTDEVLNRWSQEWDDHHRAVQEYFKDRPNDLLVFNIETDDPEKIVSFFKDYFILDKRLYTHQNRSKK